jgi:hypothetical protein
MLETDYQYSDDVSLNDSIFSRIAKINETQNGGGKYSVVSSKNQNNDSDTVSLNDSIFNRLAKINTSKKQNVIFSDTSSVNMSQIGGGDMSDTSSIDLNIFKSLKK